MTSTLTGGPSDVCSERTLKPLGAVCKNASACEALCETRGVRAFTRGPGAVFYQLPADPAGSKIENRRSHTPLNSTLKNGGGGRPGS